MTNDKNGAKERKYPQHVFLVSCGMKDNCILHMIDGKCFTQSCPMGDIEPELNPNMFKRI